MLGGFALLIVLGHVPLVALFFFCQVTMFREVKRLSKVLSTQKDLPSFRPLHWSERGNAMGSSARDDATRALPHSLIALISLLRYWFFTAMFFSYGRVAASYFHYNFPYHTFISFALYIVGVVVFVLSLEHGYYRYQFEMFAWVHLTLWLIVVQSTVIVVNMFQARTHRCTRNSARTQEAIATRLLTHVLTPVSSIAFAFRLVQGLIWFILPALLIISNDTWAYVFGFFFGRTPLIALSPKKTWCVARERRWVQRGGENECELVVCSSLSLFVISLCCVCVCREGFLGALFTTLLIGFFFSRFLAQFQLMICEKTNFWEWAHPTCEPALPFVPVSWPIERGNWFRAVMELIPGSGDWSSISISPIQWHGLALALFASVLAPFGGFFASGFKRAFNIKDFGESIPGHGGVTDRMDCQVLMGLFVFVYYQSFVAGELDYQGNFQRFQSWPEGLQREYAQKIQDYISTLGPLKA